MTTMTDEQKMCAEAWVKFAAARLSVGDARDGAFTIIEAAQQADDELSEFRARFFPAPVAQEPPASAPAEQVVARTVLSCARCKWHPREANSTLCDECLRSAPWPVTP